MGIGQSTMTAIPMLDLRGEVEQLSGEIEAAIRRVLRSGHFILGPEVEAFEQEIAAYLGVPHAIALNSGTDALLIGLRALGIEPGDEVVTSPFTFAATAGAIRLAGAIPVFVDIDPATFNLDAGQVERYLSPRTRAIVPVHLYGQAAEMDALSELAARHNLLLLEDAAQALGARHRSRNVGTLGHAAAFSFFPTKNLGAYGDGGMLVSSDATVADRARKLRAHGSAKKYFNELLGYNSRLDALQAAILRVKLPYLDAWNAARRAAAQRYDERLGALAEVTIPLRSPNAEHVFHQYTVRLPAERRDAVQKSLAAAGIASMVYYPQPLHRMAPFAQKSATFPVAEAAAREVLSLPIWPTISESAQHEVARVLKQSL